MKVTIVIPTFWRGPASESPSCSPGADLLYDHATPLDSEGTLISALASLSVLKSSEEFTVAIVAASARQEIKQAVELKVESIMAQFDYDFPFLMIGPDELVLWRRRLASAGFPQYDEFLDLEGNANIRNMCLLAGVLTEAEMVVMVDDNQLFEDADYLEKAKQYIGSRQDGRFVAGVSGFCLQPDGSPFLPGDDSVWRKTWGSQTAINEMISAGSQSPRLKIAPVVFGGNLVIHHSLFTVVPFDPQVPRGEDIDYLINARFFGFDFFLDNKLWVRQLPSLHCAPEWYLLRQDIVRFVNERAKLMTQRPGPGLRRVEIAALDPYPGRFLKENFHDIVVETSMEMASEYLAGNKEEEADECMLNIAISKAQSRIDGDPFGDYLAFQSKWAEFVQVLPEIHIWSPEMGSD